jgi:hypothetical protein
MNDREHRRDATQDPFAHPDEPGAYVGNRPERQAETIPGGVRPEDERIAANSSQTSAETPEDLPPLARESGQDR